MKRGDGKKKLLRLGKGYIPQRCELCGDQEAHTSKVPDPTVEELGDLFTVWACAECQEGVKREQEEDARKKKQLSEVDDFMEDEETADDDWLNPSADLRAVTPSFRRPPPSQSPSMPGPSVEAMASTVATHLGIPSSDLIRATRRNVLEVLRVLYSHCTRSNAALTMTWGAPTTPPAVASTAAPLTSLDTELLHDIYAVTTRCHRMLTMTRAMLIESIESFRAAQELIPTASWSDRLVQMSSNSLLNFARKVGLPTIMDFETILSTSTLVARALLLQHLNARIPVWRMLTVDLQTFTSRERQIFSSAITGSVSGRQLFSFNRADEIWRYCIASLRLVNVVISPAIPAVLPLDEESIRTGEDWQLYHWAAVVEIRRNRAYTALENGGVEGLRDLVLTSFRNMES